MDRMLRGMTTRQFQEWRAYADLEPFDETRDDLRAATIVQAILHVNRGKGRAPIRLKDCVLTFENAASSAPRTAEQARAEVRRTMEMLMLLQNPNPPKKAKR